MEGQTHAVGARCDGRSRVMVEHNIWTLQK